MGRQLGVVQYRGKLGQTVGMKNGFGGSQAFNREYVATNASESDAQITRRVRMLPAVNFRRQIEQLIARAWQGVDYGGPSTREFMKFALREPLANIPQLLKGTTEAWPGEYLISRGSLREVHVNYSSTLEGWAILGTQAVTGQTMGAVNTELERAGIAAEGDQITIVQVGDLDLGDTHVPSWHVLSWQVLADDTTNVQDFFSGQAINLELSEGGTISTFVTGGQDNLACAIVVSREGTTPKRSTSRMAVRKDLYPDIYSANLKPAVKQSYKKTTTSTVNSNWPYDPDSETEDTSTVVITVNVTPAGGGTVTGAGTYMRGDSVTLQATPAANFGFSHWEVDGQEVSTNRTLTIQANANAQYTAEFLPED